MQSFFKTILILIITAILAASAYDRNFIWRDNFSLWQDTAFKSPNKARPNYELGLAYGRKKNPEMAFYYMKRAKDLDPLFIDKWLKDKKRSS